MRFQPTGPEAALWRVLSGRRLDGVLFRLQVPIGPFIPDFLAPREKLIVEVDGHCHARRRPADARRDAKLRRWGYRVVRVEAEVVMREPEVVVARSVGASLDMERLGSGWASANRRVVSKAAGLSRKWRRGGRRPAAPPGDRRCSVQSRFVPPRSSTVVAGYARGMRFQPTGPEAALWRALSGRRLDGVLFRRQVPIGPFIADFLAPRERLIVEVDGRCHERTRHADARRDAKLRRWGYRVVRVEAALVMRRLPVALERIREALE